MELQIKSIQMPQSKADDAHVWVDLLMFKGDEAFGSITVSFPRRDVVERNVMELEQRAIEEAKVLLSSS